jgi:hypothetical protein
MGMVMTVDEKIQETLKSMGKLPTLPGIAVKILEVINFMLSPLRLRLFIVQQVCWELIR